MTVSGLNKKEVFEMLPLTLKESIILFDNKYYSQIDGVAIGSTLRPTLASIFLCYSESNWLKITRKISNLFITKDTWIIFLFCSINQNMCSFFLNI